MAVRASPSEPEDEHGVILCAPNRGRYVMRLAVNQTGRHLTAVPLGNRSFPETGGYGTCVAASPTHEQERAMWCAPGCGLANVLKVTSLTRTCAHQTCTRVACGGIQTTFSQHLCHNAASQRIMLPFVQMGR